MNTLLKILALVLATVIPAVLAADMIGVSLPSLFTASGAFGGFFVVLMLLTITSDYRRAKPLAVTEADPASCLHRSALRLAA